MNHLILDYVYQISYLQLVVRFVVIPLARCFPVISCWTNGHRETHKRPADSFSSKVDTYLQFCNKAHTLHFLSPGRFIFECSISQAQIQIDAHTESRWSCSVQVMIQIYDFDIIATCQYVVPISSYHVTYTNRHTNILPVQEFGVCRTSSLYFVTFWVNV